MNPRDIFLGISLLCIFNGFLSPVLPLVFHLAPIWMPGFVPLTQSTVLFVSSVAISFGTLFLSGVPAALFERLTGREVTDRTAMAVWLAGALALSLPGLAGLV
jgi:hypothetical protein